MPSEYLDYLDCYEDTLMCLKKRVISEKEINLFWNEARLATLKNIGLDKSQVMILASIVSQESQKKSELKTIAGVYMYAVREYHRPE